MKYNNLIYRKTKVTFYIAGLMLIIFWYFKYGYINSHTPPLSFIASTSMFSIAVIWMSVDYIFSKVITVYKTRLKEHQISILIFFLSSIAIILLSFNN